MEIVQDAQVVVTKQKSKALVSVSGIRAFFLGSSIYIKRCKMTEKKKNTPTRRIGFRIYDEEPEVEPMKTINTEEEETEETPQENSTVMLEDYIPGAVYDGAGNIVTYQSFMANVKKNKSRSQKP